MKLLIKHLFIIAWLTVVNVSCGNYLCTANDTTNCIHNLQCDFEGNKLLISYDLKDSITTNKYYVELKIFDIDGNEIIAKSVLGDLNKSLAPGVQKRIIWDIKSDYPKFNKEIRVELNATTVVYMYNPSQQFALETLYPGISSYKLNPNRKGYLLIGAAAYGAIASSIFFEYRAQESYKNYKLAFTKAERENLYNKANVHRKTSNQLLLAGAGIWALNYVRWVIAQKKSNKTLNLLNVNLEQVHGPNKYFEQPLLCLNLSMKF